MVAGGHVWLRGGMRGCQGGMHGCRAVCIVAGGVCGCWGCAWLPGGMHGCGGGHVWLPGACMVVRGMHGCQGACVVARGHAWLPGMCMWLPGGVVVGGMHGCGGACVGYNKIRSMSGRYASYWNAFLLRINWSRSNLIKKSIHTVSCILLIYIINIYSNALLELVSMFVFVLDNSRLNCIHFMSRSFPNGSAKNHSPTTVCRLAVSSVHIFHTWIKDNPRELVCKITILVCDVLCRIMHFRFITWRVELNTLKGYWSNIMIQCHVSYW